MEFANGIINIFLIKLTNTKVDLFYWRDAAVLLFASVLPLYLLYIIYKKIRRKFPFKVNCWFCCTDTKVPYELYNNWNCPHCLQYNGFNKDGGYNRVIEEQHNSKLNEKIFNTLRKKDVQVKKEGTDGFCKSCNINQQLKIQQLALFIPINEENYDEEVENFRQMLEKAYKLCENCEGVVKRTLDTQKYTFFQNKLNQDHRKHFTEFKMNSPNGATWEKFMVHLRRTTKRMRGILLHLSVLLFFALIAQLDAETEFTSSKLPNFVFLESLQPFLLTMLSFMKLVYGFRSIISISGFLIFLPFEQQTTNDQIGLFFWFLLLLTSWSTWTGLQVVVCGLSAIFNHRVVYNKKIYIRRKSLPNRWTFRPTTTEGDRKFTCEENFSDESGGISFETTGRKSTEMSNESGRGLSSAGNEDHQKKSKKNEVESSTDGPEIGQKSRTKIFNLSFESGQNDREMSPGLDDVNLSDLSLGQKVRQVPKKRANFLFDGQNFTGKTSPSSNIIKPAKFTKNTSNSWIWTEPSDFFSRSSTPSLGCFGPKPEGGRYGLATPKPLCPVPVNGYPRRDYCDYCDGNTRFYNLNCYPQDFVGLPPQYPSGPVGQGPVYGCATPPQGLPSPNFTNFRWSPSSRMSDASDSDNFLQRSGNNNNNNRDADKNWFRMNAFFYYLSVLLNCLTLACVAYFLSAGVITVDLNLPKINLFL